MKKRFAGVLIGLGLSLILLGNFTPLSFAQTTQEQCEAYTVCTTNKDLFIENVYFALEIRYDNITGRLVVDFDQNRGGIETLENRKGVGLLDEICGAKFIANNFKKLPDEVGKYTVKNKRKPVSFDFSFANFRDDCRHCTTVEHITFSPLNP